MRIEGRKSGVRRRIPGFYYVYLAAFSGSSSTFLFHNNPIFVYASDIWYVINTGSFRGILALRVLLC